MSSEAEELLREFIAQMDSTGHVSCTNTQSIAFRELNESGMLSKVTFYKSGGGYVELSTKAIHYFEDKEAASKEKQQEKLEDMVSKRQAWIMSIISGIIVGIVVTLINQLFK